MLQPVLQELSTTLAYDIHGVLALRYDAASWHLVVPVHVPNYLQTWQLYTDRLQVSGRLGNRCLICCRVGNKTLDDRGMFSKEGTIPTVHCI